MKTVTVNVFVEVSDSDVEVQVNLIKRVKTTGPPMAIQAAALVANVGVEDLISHSRVEHLVIHRRAAVAIMKEYDNLSYPDIAKHAGFTDHTSAMYHYNKHTESLSYWPKYRAAYDKVLKKYIDLQTE